MNSVAGYRILSLFVASLLVFPILTTGNSFAVSAEEYVLFTTNIEKIKAEFTIVEQNIVNREVAFAHASNVGILASQLEEPLRENDKVLADTLYLNLIDLPAIVKSGSGSDQLESHMNEGHLLLDKALITIIPSEFRNDYRFHAQVGFLLLGSADELYEDGSDANIRSATAYAERSYSIYKNKVAPDVDADLDQSFTNLISRMESGESYNSVTSAMSELQREMLALTGSTGSETQQYFDRIRTLLPELVEEYGAGNEVEADELAIEAYLDNYEYLEAPIANQDEELMLEIEEMMRVELREMIRNGAPEQEIEDHVEQILVKLDEAEELVGARTLAIDGIGIQDGNVDGNSLVVMQEETDPIGSASDDAQQMVRNEIDTIRLKLISVLEDYERGDYDSAHENARSAYLDSYEFIEIPLSPIDPNFTLETEIKFAELRGLIQQRAPYDQVQAKVVELRKSLDESERLVTGPGLIAPAIAFSASFSIIFREGLESVLIIGAIITYLEASRNEKFKKHVHYGIIAALAATAVTWVIASFIITISGVNRELIEAIAALSATGVLFYVSFWILNKIETKKWIEFVKAKVWQATTTGSAMVFVLLSFFTVYREGFETVLFYQAMLSFAKYMENYVLLGLVLGLGSLFVIYYVIRRLGKRLPLKVLFGLTMGIGAYLSIAFVGNGVRELQEAGYVGITPMFGVIPRLDINVAIMTGIHPTLETLIAQIALLSVYVVGVFYVLVWRSRKEAAIARARKSRAQIDDESI